MEDGRRERRGHERRRVRHTTVTLYVALGAKPARSTAGAMSGDAPDADAVVVARRPYAPRERLVHAPGADFNTSPIVIHDKDQDYVAAAGNDGNLYLLDGKSARWRRSQDARCSLRRSTRPPAPAAALATWDSDGTRWILAPAVGAHAAPAKFTANGLAPNGAIVAFKLADQGGKMTLEPAWASRDLTSPLAPMVVNGLVIAASSGEYRPASGASDRSAARAALAARRALRARRAHR